MLYKHTCICACSKLILKTEFLFQIFIHYIIHLFYYQILTLKNLMKRNRERAESGEPPTQHSAIGLPFILVNTSKQTTIDCSISSDK